MRPHDRAVDTEQLPVDVPRVHLAGLQVPQDAVPQAGAAPLAEAVVDGLPGAELGRDVAPAAAVGEGPQQGVDHPAVVLPLAPAFAVGGQQVLDLLPLGVGQPVGRGGDSQDAPSVTTGPPSRKPQKS